MSMFKQAQFEVIRIPYTNDPIDIQAIILIVNKAIHVFINDSSILKGIKTIQVSRAIHSMINKHHVHGQAHEYYINIVIADNQKQLVETFLRAVYTFNISVLLTWAGEWTYNVFKELNIDNLEYIYKQQSSEKKLALDINNTFRFGVDKKIYVVDGVHKCFKLVPKQPSYTAYSVITELLGKDYYKELEAYNALTGLAYAIKAITDSPWDYIASDVFNTLSIRHLLNVIQEIA